MATHTVSQDNATGAGAIATVNFTTEVFDQNGDYDGTNTFTAPVTGRYRFSFSVFIGGLTAAMTKGECALVTSNRTYRSNIINYGAVKSFDDAYTVHFSTLADMDAADTAYVTVVIQRGAGDTADLTGNAELGYFSGELVC